MMLDIDIRNAINSYRSKATIGLYVMMLKVQKTFIFCLKYIYGLSYRPGVGQTGYVFVYPSITENGLFKACADPWYWFISTLLLL